MEEKKKKNQIINFHKFHCVFKKLERKQAEREGGKSTKRKSQHRQ